MLWKPFEGFHDISEDIWKLIENTNGNICSLGKNMLHKYENE